MAVKSQRVTVTTTPTKLNVTAEADYKTNPQLASYGQHLLLRNRDASVGVDVGGLTVASGAGFQLDAGESIPVDLLPGDDIYAVTGSGSVRVDVIQAGV